ncbi:PIN-like domain-containing protein [Roseateles chitinivorans]|uniref:PIN-like domain-containing protein n=1 Tax=Roseateles chitinivorans TaxID=2917965 RepID=UPI003D6715DC
MREKFSAFYAPSADQYKRLWAEAVIVLDANVLLNVYRLPEVARNEFLGILERLKSRVWIPYHAALEFQRNRIGVIAAQRKLTEGALTAVQSVIGDLKVKLSTLEIEKRGLGIDVGPILNDLEKSHKKLAEAVGKIHLAQLDVTSIDPLRTQLDGIIGQHVGDGPKDQKDLDEILSDAENRFTLAIPPGFSDGKKEKGGVALTYVNGGVRYEAKFGDLIFWKQLLAYATKSSLRTVLLVTDDQKEDWWWREQGKTMGPHPELVGEISRTAGVELFWMYTSASFLEHAKEYFEPKISDRAVKEIQSVAAPAEGVIPTEVWRRVLRRDVGGEAEEPRVSNKNLARVFAIWFSESYSGTRVSYNRSNRVRVTWPTGEEQTFLVVAVESDSIGEIKNNIDLAVRVAYPLLNDLPSSFGIAVLVRDAVGEIEENAANKVGLGELGNYARKRYKARTVTVMDEWLGTLTPRFWLQMGDEGSMGSATFLASP